MQLKITDLKESNEFLNIVLDNINSAVFIVDNTLKIINLNSACSEILERENFIIEGKSCGEGLGCSYEINENKGCGKNSECGSCILRNDISNTFISNVPKTDAILNRDFLVGREIKNKTFKYSTRYITYGKEKMVLVIFDDITNEEIRKKTLKEQYNKIKQMNKVFKDELELAVKLQNSILPDRKIKIGSVTISTKYIPFNSISGDYYDVIKIAEDKYVIFLIDITGHGIPAALYTTLTKAILLNTLKQNESAKEIMNSLNRDISSMIIDGYYFPALLMVLDLKKKELKCVSASGPKPVIFNKKSENIVIEDRGLMIGIDEEYSYKESVINFENIDRIYMYTDGIMAVRNCEGEIVNIEEEEIKKYFKESLKETGEKSIEYVLGRILDKGNYEDDITVIDIEF